MSAFERQLHFGAILSGVGTGQNEWLHKDLPGDASVNINWYIDNARKAEAEKFDHVFIVDSPFITPDTAPHFLNRLEPLTLLSALAVSTSKIGLAGTLTTSYWEPYNVARQFASLDLISQGRAAWNVVTTGLEGAARNYGREEHFPHKERYRRAAEFVEVVKGLWDSYEDDAFPRNKEARIFLDKSKQHRLDHQGEFFRVDGPLNIQRSPQGQPVIFQAGESAEGRGFGAAFGEGIFSHSENFEHAREYYYDVKGKAAALGRNPDHIVILPGLIPLIADSEAEAREREEAQIGKLDLAAALVELGRPFNYHDFSKYDLDAPFPSVEHLTLNSYKGHAERIVNTARKRNFTLRETVWHFAAPRRPFVGTALQVADEIEYWFTGRACDGFNLRVGNSEDFARFTSEVLPILRARGLFRQDYTHNTLRGHLGLPFPENRYATTKLAAE